MKIKISKKEWENLKTAGIFGGGKPEEFIKRIMDAAEGDDNMKRATALGSLSAAMGVIIEAVEAVANGRETYNNIPIMKELGLSDSLNKISAALEELERAKRQNRLTEE